MSEKSPQADAEAWRLFSSQFDHPYDSTYWQEIQNLIDERKKELFFKACLGAGTEYVSFVGIMIRQLSDFGDPEVTGAIEPWLNLPSKKSVIESADGYFCFGSVAGSGQLPTFANDSYLEFGICLMALPGSGPPPPAGQCPLRPAAAGWSSHSPSPSVTDSGHSASRYWFHPLSGSCAA